MRIINTNRLRIYPRVILVTVWTIIGFNLVSHNGWQGGLGQIIGSDFVTLYSAGVLFETDVEALYDYDAQFNIQQDLIDPTPLPGVNPFISPPYVALAYSLITSLDLPVAFALWLGLTFVFVVLAVHWLMKLVPTWLRESGLESKQLLIIVLSFFPFALGWQVGQNHGFTLLLVTGMILFTLSSRWSSAGLLAGLLIYKPHFVLGFLILWFVWKKYSALVAFGAVTAIWVGVTLIQYGMTPYLDYLKSGSVLLRLPYIDGFPASLLVTPFGLLSTLLPSEAAPTIQIFITILMLVLSIGLAWFGFKFRDRPIDQRAPALVLGVLFPLIVTPYAMVHDLLILIPAFILWAWVTKHRYVLYVATFTYFAGFILPVLGHLTQVALLATIPIVFLIVFIYTYSSVGSNHEIRSA